MIERDARSSETDNRSAEDHPMIGQSRDWPAAFRWLLFFRRENGWRLTGITHHRVKFGFVFRTVQEERVCGSFDGCRIFERRERIMRRRDLHPAEDARMERELKRVLAGTGLFQKQPAEFGGPDYQPAEHAA